MATGWDWRHERLEAEKGPFCWEQIKAMVVSKEKRRWLESYWRCEFGCTCTCYVREWVFLALMRVVPQIDLRAKRGEVSLGVEDEFHFGDAKLVPVWSSVECGDQSPGRRSGEKIRAHSMKVELESLMVDASLAGDSAGSGLRRELCHSYQGNGEWEAHEKDGKGPAREIGRSGPGECESAKKPKKRKTLRREGVGGVVDTLEVNKRWWQKTAQCCGQSVAVEAVGRWAYSWPGGPLI